MFRCRKLLLLNILLVVISSQKNYSQQNESNEAFSKISITAKYLYNLENKYLDEFWSAKNGYGLGISFPFYKGIMELGVDYMPFEGYRTKYTNFKSYYIYLGWNNYFDLILHSSLVVGVKIGSFLMIFEDYKLTEFESNESELGIAALAGWKINVWENFGLYTNTEWTNIFTKHNLKFLNITGGIFYSFDSPEWLRDFLK